ncbi:MAG: hypothetical protein AAGB34_02225, partial [Planctomycetota bacterium]
VIYAPATPAGTVVLDTGAEPRFAQPDPVFSSITQVTPVYQRRLTPVQIITEPTFTIDMDLVVFGQDETAPAKNAFFRTGRGYRDLDESGSVDLDFGEFAGFEIFDTQTRAIQGVAGSLPGFEQTLNTDVFEEGMNYLLVQAELDRSFGDPVTTDWRFPIYVDRKAPELGIEIFNDIDCGETSAFLSITNPDYTAHELHVFIGLAPDQEIPLLSSLSRATRVDRDLFTFAAQGITDEGVSLTLVAIERVAPQNRIVNNAPGSLVSQHVLRFDIVPGVGVVEPGSVSQPPCIPEPCTGDANGDDVVNVADFIAVLLNFGNPFALTGDANGDDVVDVADFIAVLLNFGDICN